MAKLWYDARASIARELGVSNLEELEIVQLRLDTDSGAHEVR